MNSEIRNTKHKTQNTKHKTPNPSRSAFTLVELLVVIVILLIVASLAFAVFKGNSTDKLRSAARIAQSAFLGAKDRALHARELRGVRLTRDTTDPTLANGFVYLQPLPIQTTGNLPGQPNLNNITVTRPNLASGNTDATQILISLPQGQIWYQQDQSAVWPPGTMQVRIPAQSGQWLNLARIQNTPPYWGTMNAGNLQLTLQVPYQGGHIYPPDVNAINNYDINASIDIQLGNEVLPFHQPIPLPSGVVIDLKFCSTNVQSLAGIGTGVNYFVDIMFSPRGSVSGYLSGLGPLHFLLRDLKDATAGVNPLAVGNSTSTNPDLSTGDRLILTVFPQTGLVQVFEIDPTDKWTSGTTAGPPDGLADNIFNFAQQGKTAGR
jgi:prepilin-type N-terminal cleavage/methylation domain-containing protein